MIRRLIAVLPWLVGAAILTSGPLPGQEAVFAPPQIEFFENRIRPLLIEHCLECHGDDPDSIAGGLKLTSRPAMLAGGDSGPAIVPGQPDQSLLLEAVHYETFEMPPAGQLPAESIAALEEWVAMGAPDPRRENAPPPSQKAIDLEEGRQHWSFQPIAAPPTAAPSPRDPWCRSEIDRLVLARLDEEGIEPLADAPRAILLRRVYFALVGLPPDEATVRTFVNSPRSLEDDLTRVVDDLLSRPEFGERWGRHWLDVARFAESSGGGRSLMFPHAWRYRDYVIESFNADKPFDQFIREQIAGDLLPAESPALRSEQLIGSGFLLLGPTNYEQQDKQLLQMEVVDEQLDTIGRAFLGMTLGCARCHDHKFDPIPMTDYYALAGILLSTQSLVDGNVSRYTTQTIATEKEIQAHREYRKRIADLTRQFEEADAQVARLGGTAQPNQRVKSIPPETLPGVVLDNREAKLVGSWKSSTHTAGFVGGEYIHDDGQPKGANRALFRPELDQGGFYEVRLAYTPGGNRASNVPVQIDHQDGQARVTVNQSQPPPIDGTFVSLGTFRFEANNLAAVTISNEGTDGVVIADAVQFLPQDAPSIDPAARDSIPNGDSVPDRRLAGNPPAESAELQAARQRRDELDRQLTELKKHAPRPLAEAMAVGDAEQPADGPLLVRGNVHRVSGTVPRGLLSVIDSPPPPTIPQSASGRRELAEWIASPEHPLTARVYVNRIWRHLFGRGLVATPDNFGKMGQTPSHPELLDYLANSFVQSGWSTKRLIREMILSRVFRLQSDSPPGSRAAEVDPDNELLWRANRRRVDAEVLRDSILAISGQLDPARGGQTIRKLSEYDLGYEFDTRRRSVYVPAFRNSRLELFEVFDMANPNMVVGHRHTSTLPTQALYLMNSPWIAEQATAAAERLMNEEAPDRAARLDRIFVRVLGRPPSPRESELSFAYLDHVTAESSEAEAWARLIHGLLASLDFRYLH